VASADEVTTRPLQVQQLGDAAGGLGEGGVDLVDCAALGSETEITCLGDSGFPPA
jgi:hypothetical protein